LIASHVSLSLSQKEQEKRQLKILDSLEELEPQVHQMVSAMLLGAAKVGQSLEDVDDRLQTMGYADRNRLSLGIIAFSLALWFGRDHWRSFVGCVGVSGRTKKTPSHE
jgi:hypothetical protein